MSAEAIEEVLADDESANLALWERVLTELEDNLEVFREPAEMISVRARDLALGWEPPSNLGPMPAVLMPRVRLLAKAQERAYIQLRGEARTNRRQSELIRNVPGPSAAAVYLDVAG